MKRTPLNWGKPPQFNLSNSGALVYVDFLVLKIILFIRIISDRFVVGKLTMGWHGNNQQSCIRTLKN